MPGLCRGVIAEAKMRSGSLITCESEQWKKEEVYLLFLDLFLMEESDGCHHLIQEGINYLRQALMFLSEFDF